MWHRHKAGETIFFFTPYQIRLFYKTNFDKHKGPKNSVTKRISVTQRISFEKIRKDNY